MQSNRRWRKACFDIRASCHGIWHINKNKFNSWRKWSQIPDSMDGGSDSGQNSQRGERVRRCQKRSKKTYIYINI
jgi:hypothetical protein